MNYRKFKLDKKVYLGVSGEEKKILKILEEVVMDMAKVYEQQLKDGFYPQDATKEQLEKAAEKNPAIFSPFTFVKRKDGGFEAIPYYQKYAPLLEIASKKIERAAKISTNRSFKNYLKARAKSLLDGSYKQADKSWFAVKNSRIDFSVGPFERYLDKLFFIKRVYQAHVGIIDIEETEMAEQIKETLYSSAKMSFDATHSTDIPKKGVQVLVERTPATSGYMSDVLFTGEHFPSDLDVMLQYGSKILIYRSQFKLRFEKLQYPLFKVLFEKRFASKYSKELLKRASGWTILLYELSRQLHKFLGARERLKEYYAPIDEANAIVSGIQHAKHLVVKGLISQDELEAIMIIHIVRIFANWILRQQSSGLEKHVMGEAIALNTYLDKGALKEKGGISWPNFSKMFFEIEALAVVLVHLLREGTYKEAEKFVRENTDLKNIERLAKGLKVVKSNI